MKAINNNVILKRINEESNTSIIIMTSFEKNKAIVYDKDPNITSLEIGNTVLFDEEKASSFTYENEEYLVCNIKDILVILK